MTKPIEQDRIKAAADRAIAAEEARIAEEYRQYARQLTENLQRIEARVASHKVTLASYQSTLNWLPGQIDALVKKSAGGPPGFNGRQAENFEKLMKFDLELRYLPRRIELLQDTIAAMEGQADAIRKQIEEIET